MLGEGGGGGCGDADGGRGGGGDGDADGGGGGSQGGGGALGDTVFAAVPASVAAGVPNMPVTGLELKRPPQKQRMSTNRSVSHADPSPASVSRHSSWLGKHASSKPTRFSKRQRSSHLDVTVTAVSLLYLTWWWAMQHSSPEASAQSGYGAPEGCIRSCTALTMESRLNIRYEPRSTVRVTLRASVATSGHKTFCTKTLLCA